MQHQPPHPQYPYAGQNGYAPMSEWGMPGSMPMPGEPAAPGGHIPGGYRPGYVVPPDDHRFELSRNATLAQPTSFNDLLDEFDDPFEGYLDLSSFPPLAQSMYPEPPQAPPPEPAYMPPPEPTYMRHRPPTPASVDEYLLMLGDMDDEDLDGLPPLFGMTLPQPEYAAPAQPKPEHAVPRQSSPEYAAPAPPSAIRPPMDAIRQPTDAIPQFLESLTNPSQAEPQSFAQAPTVPVLSPAPFTAFAAKPPLETPKPQTNKRRWTAKRALTLVFNIAVLLFCGVVITATMLFSFSSRQNKSFLGLYFFNVESGSMTPTVQASGLMPKDGFKEGDAIVVKKIPPEDVAAGDIITFDMKVNNQNKRNSHRVVKVLDQWNGEPGLFFVTKGDANNGADDKPVPGKSVIGKKILTLPWLGRLMRLAKAYPKTFIACSAALILGLLVMFFWLSRPRKNPAPQALPAPGAVLPQIGPGHSPQNAPQYYPNDAQFGYGTAE